ncbi:MAG: sigma-70 family RNA polymerase sigma factor [Candidatus Kaelpia imicola]|nr:sigma-70 family RNA polymerase sigma factor [Candidatus Kaelpia imicola]
MTCSICPKKSICRTICQDVKKEITGRHKTAGVKKKTYTVDYDKICDSSEPLNSFQIGILNTIKGFSAGIKDELASMIALKEAISTLNDREKEVVQLYRAKCKQREIATKLGVSQQRVDFLLKRIFKKLEKYGKGEL